MTTTPQPIKLNYAKARQKSKGKNESESQYKNAFEGQPSSDLFSHLNQDNLNYIKKELKHKQSLRSNQRSKNLQISNQLQKKHTQTQKQTKINQKYKNPDEVTEKDSRQEQTVNEIQIDESQIQEPHLKNHLGFVTTHNKQVHSRISTKSYESLQSPLATFTTKNHEPSHPPQSYNLKQQIPTLSSMKIPPVSSKNNFLQYELKSQTSNHQIAQSLVSNDKQSFQSLEMKGSHFIDYLQNYIEQLNVKSEKNPSKGLRTFDQASRLQSFQDVNKNFKKIKGIKNSDQSVQSETSERKKYLRNQKQQKNIDYSTRQKLNRTQLLYNSSQNYSPQIQEVKQNKNFAKKNSQNVEVLKSQLQRQKYYCTKLALQLEKYKQNQSLSKKEIHILQQTVNLLQMEVENFKSLYEKQASQTQKILLYIETQKRNQQKKYLYKENRQVYQSQSSPDQLKNPFNQPTQKHRKPLKSINQTSYSVKSSRKIRSEFGEFMKINSKEPIYNHLDPHIMNCLIKQFQKGQQTYRNAKQTLRQHHHSNVGNSSFTHSQRKMTKEINFQSLPKHSQKIKNMNNLFQLLDSKQEQMQKLFSRQKSRKDIYKKKNQRAVQAVDSSFSESYKKSKSSLEKLKKQYELFKAQAYTSRIQNKKPNIKKDSINSKGLPKQFSQIFMK